MSWKTRFALEVHVKIQGLGMNWGERTQLWKHYIEMEFNIVLTIDPKNNSNLTLFPPTIYAIGLPKTVEEIHSAKSHLLAAWMTTKEGSSNQEPSGSISTWIIHNHPAPSYH